VAGYIKLAESDDALALTSFDVDGSKNLTVDLSKRKVQVSKATTNTISLTDATLTLTNGTLEETATNASGEAFLIEKGSLELNDITLNAEKWGIALSNKGENAKITLSESHFNAEGTGFINTVHASVYLIGSSFSGNHQGALLRGGDIFINGSTFTLNAELTSDNEDCHLDSDWGEGNKAAFAALVIGNRGTAIQRGAEVIFGSTKSTGEVTGTNKAQFPAAYIYGVDGNNVTVKGDMTAFKSSGYSQHVVVGGNVNSGKLTTPDRQGESGIAAGKF
jgi:hypothetical protein